MISVPQWNNPSQPDDASVDTGDDGQQSVKWFCDQVRCLFDSIDHERFASAAELILVSGLVKCLATDFLRYIKALNGLEIGGKEED